MAKADDKANGKAEQAPANMPLFYTKPTPLDAKAHGDLGLKKNFGFDFTTGINAVPVNLIEMPQICHHYPIAFSPDGNATPVAILGLRDNENLFLKADKSWEEDSYIPAYIRRYPFIFSEMPGGDQLTLCVDMNDNVIEKGGAQPFFDKEGKPSELANNALEFVNPTTLQPSKRSNSPKLLPMQVFWLIEKPRSMWAATSASISPAL